MFSTIFDQKRNAFFKLLNFYLLPVVTLWPKWKVKFYCSIRPKTNFPRPPSCFHFLGDIKLSLKIGNQAKRKKVGCKEVKKLGHQDVFLFP